MVSPTHPLVLPPTHPISSQDPVLSLHFKTLESIPLSVTLPSSCLPHFSPGLYHETISITSLIYPSSSLSLIFKYKHQIIFFKIRAFNCGSFSFRLLVCRLTSYHCLLNLIFHNPKRFRHLKFFLL